MSFLRYLRRGVICRKCKSFFEPSVSEEELLTYASPVIEHKLLLVADPTSKLYNMYIYKFVYGFIYYLAHFDWNVGTLKFTIFHREN